MNPDPLVSVIVPTRNRAGLLAALLESLEAQTYPHLEIVVVDDASVDGTPHLLGAWQGPGRCAIRLERPGGSYAARNRGWRAARGSTIAFTDDDCLPDPDWVARLVRALTPEAVGVQGVTLVGPGRVTPFTHQIHQRQPGPPYRTCNIAYRRDLLERLGGFTELRWYADNMFGLRAREVGRIAFAPDALVRHPPRPREWRDRAAWRARFSADRVHRAALRRHGEERVELPGRVLPVVLWVLRPLVKQLGAHLRYAALHPVSYTQQIGPMAREKWELMMALRDAHGVEREDLLPLPGHPSVSVVIVTRDRPHLLSGALDALDRQTRRPDEVVVIDHGTDRQTREIARAHGARHVAVDPSGMLGAARQIGVDMVEGDIIAFTDDDCVPDSAWLEHLVAAFARDSGLWGVQGRTEAESISATTQAMSISAPSLLFQTCNIAYRRVALDRVGGFDPRFDGWFEDTALGARITARGHVGFEPGARVVHRAVPRRLRDRATWRRLLRDERLLARAYPRFYRRTRGPGVLAVVVGRWLIGSPLKTMWQVLRRPGAAPGDMLRLGMLLARERWALLGALRDPGARE